MEDHRLSGKDVGCVLKILNTMPNSIWQGKKKEIQPAQVFLCPYTYKVRTEHRFGPGGIFFNKQEKVVLKRGYIEYTSPARGNNS